MGGRCGRDPCLPLETEAQSLSSLSLRPSHSPNALYASVPVRDFKRAAVSAGTRPHAMSTHAQLKCCPSYANPHLSPIPLPPFLSPNFVLYSALSSSSFLSLS